MTVSFWFATHREPCRLSSRHEGLLIPVHGGRRVRVLGHARCVLDYGRVRPRLVKHVRAAWQDVARGEVVIWPALTVGLIVAAVALLVGSRRGDVRVDIAMGSMAAFLFGVLLAFTIVRTRERLVLVQDLVATSDASLLTLHDAVAVFGDPRRDEIRDLIDEHLTDQIDYRLVDYHRASPSFRALINAVLALQPRNPEQDAVYKELVARCFVLDNDRALIEAAGGQAMSPLEWTGLLLLLAVLLGLLAVLPRRHTSRVLGGGSDGGRARHADRPAPKARSPSLARAGDDLGADDTPLPEHGPRSLRTP